jgi:predicted RNA binding protein YcfA (HicA-like mRNA interferase family)
MPRKKRNIRRDYRQAGFSERQGKGDHVIFWHPLVKDIFTVDGHDGDDAKPYDEKELRKALQALQEAQRRQQS